MVHTTSAMAKASMQGCLHLGPVRPLEGLLGLVGAGDDVQGAVLVGQHQPRPISPRERNGGLHHPLERPGEVVPVRRRAWV
jgi:hypothetical protein